MIRWLLALLALLTPQIAAADELRPVSILFEQTSERDWTLGWREPLAVPRSGVPPRPILPPNCRPAGEPRLDIAPLSINGRVDVSCDGPVAGLAMGWNFATPGEAILRVAPLNRPVQVHRLTPGESEAIISAKASSTQVWRSYFVIGLEHILMGWDHLLFVIALVLLVRAPWPVVKAATAFTVAHSITLAATILGFAGLPQRPVEVMIALSIVFLAVEIARGTKKTLTQRLPWVVAFLFGLLHGFGFAGALRDIGLPEGEVPSALVSFNLGVEAGQLLVVAVVLLLLAGLSRVPSPVERRSIQFASYGIGIVGAYWLVDRLIG